MASYLTYLKPLSTSSRLAVVSVVFVVGVTTLFTDAFGS